MIPFIQGLDSLLTGILVGFLAFLAWVLPAAEPGDAAAFRRHSRRFAATVAVLALIASVSRFLFIGTEMADSWAPGDLWLVLSRTSFGRGWAIEIAAVSALVATTLRRTPGRWSLGLALLLPLGFAWTGHARTAQEPVLSFLLDTCHFLCVGLWAGGLVSLLLFLRTAAPGQAIAPLREFSRLALAYAVIIAASGVLLALDYGVHPLRLPRTDYEKLIALKTGIFVMALGIASLNRYSHVASWERRDPRELVRAVSLAIELELALIALAFGAAGFLTRLPPPGS